LDINIAIDSNTWTYAIEAVRPEYDPSDDDFGLAPERIAILRIRFYGNLSIGIFPSVHAEIKKIGNEGYLKAHEQSNLFYYIRPPNDAPVNHEKERWINNRTHEFLCFHSGPKDCRITAEAEYYKLNGLLTCDEKFLRNLGDKTRGLLLKKPTQYWETLGVEPGSTPIISPAPPNPLYHKTWWRI